VARPARSTSATRRFARSLTAAALEHPLPPRLVLNVNVPSAAAPRGWAVTRLGRHSYGNQVVENTDPRGRLYYWIGGSGYAHEDLPGSDCNAVLDENLISVTPVLLELTDLARMEEIGRWSVEGFLGPGARKSEVPRFRGTQTGVVSHRLGWPGFCASRGARVPVSACWRSRCWSEADVPPPPRRANRSAPRSAPMTCRRRAVLRRHLRRAWRWQLPTPSRIW
jgi:hypothetical protein